MTGYKEKISVIVEKQSHLHVPGMKINLVSISSLEDKGHKVAFSYGKVLAWHKNSSMEVTKEIGVREESLYRLITPLGQALVHDSTSMGELWHRRLAHINYRALLALRNIVMGLAALHLDHDGVCRGCTLGKNTKGSFPNSKQIQKNIGSSAL